VGTNSQAQSKGKVPFKGVVLLPQKVAQRLNRPSQTVQMEETEAKPEPLPETQWQRYKRIADEVLWVIGTAVFVIGLPGYIAHKIP
jgi:hypothetical protein